ncbi:MAG: alpha/beta hydrolase [Candidatus Jordarchaeales archaeon]
MKHEEGFFEGHDKTKLYYQVWKPDRESKAVVVVVHGLVEHSGRYMNVVNQIVPKGYAIYALDHRGHGKCEGERAQVKRVDEFIDDLKLFVDLVRKKEKGKKIFMLGHSMGSLIAMLYVARYPEGISGLVLSGTGARPGRVSPLVKALLALIAKIAPKSKFTLPWDPSFISRDEKVVEAYVNDPLVSKKASARLLAEVYYKTFRAAEEAAKINVPCLLQVGSADVAFEPGSAKDLHDVIPAKDKTLKVYEGYRHEVYNEVGKEKPLSDLEEWLEKHI